MNVVQPLPQPFQNRIHHNRPLPDQVRKSMTLNFGSDLLPELHTFSFSTVSYSTYDGLVHNFGVTFETHISFSNHFFHLLHPCFVNICDLYQIRPMFTSKTASTAISVVHSKLAYCKSLFLKFETTH